MRVRAVGAGLLAPLLVLASACGGGAGSASPGPARSAGTPGPQSAGPAAPGPWHLVFGDDFDGHALDPAKWTTCYDWNNGGCTNAGNHELQWYRPEQVTVGGGTATLTAQRRATVGGDGRTYPWTSGMISTGRDSWDAAPRHVFTYGYVEASVRMPGGDGMFPAFWLMPESRRVPPEIDAGELIGTSQYLQMTLHWAGPDGADLHQDAHWGPVDFPSAFHTLAVDWEPDALTWYVDGVERYRVADTSKIPAVPMEVLLTLAVGYPAAPPDGVDSARLDVDRVRVWQH
ncbi:hypothetical protein GCM10010441_76710 [Kitasatospora paracochleata]